jgi:hypothetical protein
MKKIKSFTNWSLVFLFATVCWLIFEQNKKADGYGAAMLPLIIAVGIMAYYERRIRLQMKGSPHSDISN